MDRSDNTGWPSNQFVAGMLAGGGSTAIMHPLDMIKVRLQMNRCKPIEIARRPFFYTFHRLAQIGRQFGLRGLYLGFSANWTASMASWGLYFYIYDRLKTLMQLKDRSSFSLKYFLASGLAGAATTTIVNPLWVVKTRRCFRYPGARYSGLFSSLKTLAEVEGLRGLYRGLLPGILGVSHGAVQFTLYENGKAYLAQNQVDLDNWALLGLSTGTKAAAMAITYPFQLVRSRAQLPRRFGRSLRRIIYRTFVREGVPGFYKGLGPSTLRVLPGTALTFLIYENTIKWLGTD